MEDVKQNADQSNQQQQSNQQDVKQADTQQQSQQSQQDVKQQAQVQKDVKADEGAGVKTDPALLLKSLQEERDRRRTAEAERDVLKQAGVQPQQYVQPQPQSPQNQLQGAIQEALDQGDIGKAMNMNTMAAFQWYDSINAGLEAQRDAVRTKYPDFNSYEAQAMAHVRTLPLNQRMVEGVVEMAYLVEKGKMADKIIQTAKEAQVDDVIKRLQAGESIQGISAGQGQPATPQGTQPTADQIKAAEVMGIPIAEYMKHQRPPAGP